MFNHFSGLQCFKPQSCHLATLKYVCFLHSYFRRNYLLNNTHVLWSHCEKGPHQLHNFDDSNSMRKLYFESNSGPIRAKGRFPDIFTNGYKFLGNVTLCNVNEKRPIDIWKCGGWVCFLYDNYWNFNDILQRPMAQNVIQRSSIMVSLGFCCSWYSTNS